VGFYRRFRRCLHRRTANPDEFSRESSRSSPAAIGPGRCPVHYHPTSPLSGPHHHGF
jgi:hypothetical protein